MDDMMTDYELPPLPPELMPPPGAPSRLAVAAELGRRGHQFANFSYTPGPDAGTKTASEIADMIEAAFKEINNFNTLPEADQLRKHLFDTRNALQMILDETTTSLDQFIDPATRELTLKLSKINCIADMALITLPSDLDNPRKQPLTANA